STRRGERGRMRPGRGTSSATRCAAEVSGRLRVAAAVHHGRMHRPKAASIEGVVPAVNDERGAGAVTVDLGSSPDHIDAASVVQMYEHRKASGDGSALRWLRPSSRDGSGKGLRSLLADGALLRGDRVKIHVDAPDQDR